MSVELIIELIIYFILFHHLSVFKCILGVKFSSCDITNLGTSENNKSMSGLLLGICFVRQTNDF